MDVWFWFWAILAAVLTVAEIFTAGFFLLPFGIGAAVAALLAYVEFGLGWQWAAFLGVSALALWGMRHFAERFTHEPPEKVGVDRLIGKTGVVIEQLEVDAAIGRVRIEREEWRADAPGYEPLPVGTRVIVERVEGTHLVVCPIDADAAGVAADES